ncbi:MAG: oligosaccharide flippase family protein [Streptococcaceae bacterium]|jgi:O-antigen/teichoic acid export membrane protein|nr:oligosaccharide flippase family protein [Streptococcaceae bacterium]
MKLLKNMAYNSFYQVLLVILPLITAPYISRVLGADNIGINAIVSSVNTYFVLLCGLGINLYGNREIAYHQNNKEERSKIFYELLVLKAIMFFISGTLFLIMVSLQRKWQIFYLVQGLSIVNVFFDVSWFFMGLEKYKIIVLRNTAIQILMLVCIFIFVKQPGDLVKYIFLLAGAPLLGSLSIWPLLRRELVPAVWPKFSNIWQHFKLTAVLFLPQVAISVYVTTNKTILGALSGVTQTGYFYQSYVIVSTTLGLIGGLNSALLPHLANLFSEQEHAKIEALTQKIMQVNLAFSILLASGIIGVSSTFAVFFFGSSFQEAGKLLLIFPVNIVIISISSVIGSQFLLATKKNKEFAFSVFLGLFVSIPLNFIFISSFDALGAVIALIATELSVTLSQLFFVRKAFHLRQLLAGFWKYVLAGACTVSVLLYLNTTISPSLVDYLFQAIVGCAVYVGLIFVLRAPFIQVMRPFIGEYMGHLKRR